MSLKGVYINNGAFHIIKKLQEAGFKAYLVGGAVRDMLLGEKPKDFDISTAATPEEVKKLFGRRARIIGRRFQIVHIRDGREVYEISTFRRTPSEEERKARVEDDGQLVWRDNEWGSPQEDALRRDFTVNALFSDPMRDNEILDYCNALDDIDHGRIRCLGDPLVRFTEDPVRMLRALKLVAQYDFALEEDCVEAILEKGYLLEQVSQRRLYEEILKITHKSYCARTFELCHKYGLLKFILPNMDKLLSGPEKEDYLRFLTFRDDRIAKGCSLSRAYSVACLTYRNVEKRLNKGSNFGDGWEYEPGVESACRKAIEEFMYPHNVTRLISARVRDVLLLHERMLKSKSDNPRVMRHPEYHYGQLLYATLADSLEWPEEKRTRWRPNDRKHASPRRRQAVNRSRNRQRQGGKNSSDKHKKGSSE